MRLISFLGFFLISSGAWAASPPKPDIFDVPKIVAVQNRQYYLNRGITLNLGYLPVDSFHKGLVAGLAYTHYFSDFAAWEVLNANYVADLKTDLLGQLQNFGVQPQSLPDFVQYFVTSNIIYTPFYNKSLLFNKTIVWGETSFLAGAGAGSFQKGGWSPLVEGGLNLSWYISQNSSIKMDVREIVAFLGGTTGVQTILYVGLGYTFQLGEVKPRGESLE